MIQTDAQIKELEEELLKLKARQRKETFEKFVKPLDSISDAQKIEWFDKSWHAAYEELMVKVNAGEYWCDDDDDIHYAWEAYMQILGNDVFALYNRTDLA